MLDMFQRIAQSLRFLRYPSALLGMLCLLATAMILFAGWSEEIERFLRPSLIGFVWAVIVYSFIATFSAVPVKADKSQKFLDRLKRKLVRGWYWLIAVVFVCSLGASVVFTSRLVFIWLRAAIS